MVKLTKLPATFNKITDIFTKHKNLLPQKFEILKDLTIWDNKSFELLLSKYLKILNKDMEEEDLVNEIIKPLKKYLDEQLLSSPVKKEIRYVELKNAISLYHRIESCLSINLKQIKIIKKIKDNNLEFEKYKNELFQLLKNEASILDKESEMIKILGQEEKEISNTPSFQWDYTLVGYGSLMNSKQIADELCSISDEVKQKYKENPDETISERIVPVIVYGWQRVFNRRATSPKWLTPRNWGARKALAVMDLSLSHKNYFNAVAIKVSSAELKQIYKREIDYKLIKLKHVKNFVTGENLPHCICFKSPVGEREADKFNDFDKEIKQVEKGKTFLSRNKGDGEFIHFLKNRFIRSDMTPPPNYFKVCVNGAKGLDKILGTDGMYKTFLKTTYLYYIDRVLDKSGKKTKKCIHYGKFSVYNFLKTGYKLKGQQDLLVKYKN